MRRIVFAAAISLIVAGASTVHAQNAGQIARDSGQLVGQGIACGVPAPTLLDIRTKGQLMIAAIVPAGPARESMIARQKAYEEIYAAKQANGETRENCSQISRLLATSPFR